MRLLPKWMSIGAGFRALNLRNIFVFLFFSIISPNLFFQKSLILGTRLRKRLQVDTQLGVIYMGGKHGKTEM